MKSAGYPHIGAFIKAARKAKKLKQGEVAKHLQISQSYYCEMETGKKRLPVLYFDSLISFLDLDRFDNKTFWIFYNEMLTQTGEPWIIGFLKLLSEELGIRIKCRNCGGISAFFFHPSWHSAQKREDANLFTLEVNLECLNCKWIYTFAFYEKFERGRPVWRDVRLKSSSPPKSPSAPAGSDQVPKEPDRA